MDIQSFGDLLEAAQQQPKPQRMLFLFVKTRLQKEHSEAERAGFEAGEGGALQPMFCVDLTPAQVQSFAALAAEASQRSPDWDKVLVACMDDAPSSPAADAQVDDALKQMVARVEAGQDLRGYLFFARDGSPLTFG